MIWETSFLNGCPLNAGNSTPNCDLQISLGKTRSVSTNLFMLRELLSDDSKLHPAKHVELCGVFRITLVVMLRISVLRTCGVLLYVVRTLSVNVYCDLDVSCIVACS